MWLSHLISLKVTDLSNTMRITSFNHYRTATSPINTGGLCTSATKPPPGSILHTSETNYTLKGRWHVEHRKILSAKLSLCLKKEKGEKSIYATKRVLFGTLPVTWHFPGLPLKCRTHLLDTQAGGRQKCKNASRDCSAEDPNRCIWHSHEGPALQHQPHNALENNQCQEQ